MRPRLILMAVGAVFFFGVSLLAAFNRSDVDESTLVARCTKSEPEWLTYQEDIKGQIGAGPVACWQGRPVQVALEDRRLVLTFALEAPWSTYGRAAIPVLMRTPDGMMYLPKTVEPLNNLRTYVYTLHASATPASLPWIEIHYPHTERRILLDSKGQWRAE